MIETRPVINPVIIKKGRWYKDSILPISRLNRGSKPKNNFVKKYETIDDTNIGANEERDCCLKITSRANISPANGAPKPEEIAPATPEPTKIWYCPLVLNKFFISAPNVAPKWTSGPYCPTDPPADIDKIEEKEVKKPDFMSRGFFSEWTDNITSGGPCHLESDEYFLIKPTNSPTKDGTKIAKSNNLNDSKEKLFKISW